MKHWHNIGIKENRICSDKHFFILYPYYDHNSYKLYNKDLDIDDKIDLMKHWHNIGIKENRICSDKHFEILYPNSDINKLNIHNINIYDFKNNYHKNLPDIDLNKEVFSFVDTSENSSLSELCSDKINILNNKENLIEYTDNKEHILCIYLKDNLYNLDNYNLFLINSLSQINFHNLNIIFYNKENNISEYSNILKSLNISITNDIDILYKSNYLIIDHYDLNLFNSMKNILKIYIPLYFYDSWKNNQNEINLLHYFKFILCDTMNLSQQSGDKELFSEVSTKENTMNLSQQSGDKELFSEVSTKENTMNLSQQSGDKELFSEVSTKENTESEITDLYEKFNLNNNIIISEHECYYLKENTLYKILDTENIDYNDCNTIYLCIDWFEYLNIKYSLEYIYIKNINKYKIIDNQNIYYLLDNINNNYRLVIYNNKHYLKYNNKYFCIDINKSNFLFNKPIYIFNEDLEINESMIISNFFIFNIIFIIDDNNKKYFDYNLYYVKNILKYNYIIYNKDDLINNNIETECSFNIFINNNYILDIDFKKIIINFIVNQLNYYENNNIIIKKFIKKDIFSLVYTPENSSLLIDKSSDKLIIDLFYSSFIKYNLIYDHLSIYIENIKNDNQYILFIDNKSNIDEINNKIKYFNDNNIQINIIEFNINKSIKEEELLKNKLNYIFLNIDINEKNNLICNNSLAYNIMIYIFTLYSFQYNNIIVDIFSSTNVPENSSLSPLCFDKFMVVYNKKDLYDIGYFDPEISNQNEYINFKMNILYYSKGLNIYKKLFLYDGLYNFLISNKDYLDIFLYYIRNKLTINSYSIKTIFINLDDRKDRLENILKELDNNKINNYERFSGIKCTEYLENILNKNKCWKKMDIKYIKSASGCKMSHLEVFKKYRNCKSEYILILEDDAQFEQYTMDFSKYSGVSIKENINIYLNLALEQLKDKEWDILYLTCNLKKKEDAYKVSPNLLFINNALTTTAQLFKVSDIDKIIKIIESSDIEIDNTYSDFLKNKYCVYPMCAYQMESYSDINKKILNYGNFHKKYRYEL